MLGLNLLSSKPVGGHRSQFPSAALFDAYLNSSKEHGSPLAWSCSEAPSSVSETVCDVCCPYFTSSLYFWEGLLFLLLTQVITDLGPWMLLHC